MNHDLIPVPTGSLIIPRLHAPSDIKLSLIIPTYKESENIPALIAQLTNLLQPILESAYELIIVDDNSPDLTWQVAQNIMPEYPHLRVMRRETERGLSTAVIRG
ncbi:MAG: glycosyltransferase, partial [Microcoleaceae cyanobacterium]